MSYGCLDTTVTPNNESSGGSVPPNNELSGGVVPPNNKKNPEVRTSE